jgi:hypothetical protein
MNCPLCDETGCEPLLEDRNRTFNFCGKCELVFVPEKYHLGFVEEVKRYDLHDNTFGNKGYVEFLLEIVRIVKTMNTPDAKVLDFGCGKNAVLGELLRQKGSNCDSYDPLYSIGTECLLNKYDILVMCEVIEHLRDLKNEINTMKKIVCQTGSIVLRTNLYPSLKEFPAWWYKEDMTHINFFNSKSIEVFARKSGFTRLKQIQSDIFLMDK